MEAEISQVIDTDFQIILDYDSFRHISDPFQNHSSKEQG